MGAREELNRLYALKKERKAAAAQARTEFERRSRNTHAPAPTEDMSRGEELIRSYCDWEPWPGFWAPKHSGYSDYSGSFYEKSNSQYWLSHYGFFTTVDGGHGTVWIGIRPADIPGIAEEDLDRLENDLSANEDGPLDEDLMYQMESEAKWESWTEGDRASLRQEVVQQASDDPLTVLGALYMPDEALDELYRSEQLDELQKPETGCLIYFDTDRAVQQVGLEVFLYYGEEHYKDTEYQAFVKNLPEFIGVVRAHFRDEPEKVSAIEALDDGQLFRLFKRLESLHGENAWRLEDDKQDDPVDVFSFDDYTLNRFMERLEDDALISQARSREDDPRQLKLSLESQAQGLAYLMLKP